MSERRVVITGMGWVTPLGFDLDGVWRRLLAGDSAIGAVTKFDAQTFATNFGAQIHGFNLRDHLPSANGKHEQAGDSTKYALAAAANAWRHAGLGEAGERAAGVDPERAGVYMGAGEGTVDYDAFMGANVAGWDHEKKALDSVAWARRAYSGMSATSELEQEPHLTVSHMATAFGLRGPAFNCMTACAASAQATGEAAEIIKRGDADLMLAGGSHMMLHPLGMTGFIRLTAMSTRRDDPQHASRPFDATRDGFVMGAGAGVLVLEELGHARTRGAHSGGGRGVRVDGRRVPDHRHPPRGQRGRRGRCQERCARRGSTRTRRTRTGALVHYIAHGTGTKENDRIETLGVKAVFGALAKQVPFSSVKSMLGHLIQAAGAVELITCVKAIETGWIPATMNRSHPDPV
ncbi:MAG: beta-ketoacyl-[acyl-carrier-protein] synthase family protein [Phycisphaerales bacterium]